jgi:hypothetical protein
MPLSPSVSNPGSLTAEGAADAEMRPIMDCHLAG